MRFASVFLGQISYALLEIPSCEACKLETIFHSCPLWHIKIAHSAAIACLHLHTGRLLWNWQWTSLLCHKEFIHEKGSDINPQWPSHISGQTATIRIFKLFFPQRWEPQPAASPSIQRGESASQHSEGFICDAALSQPKPAGHGAVVKLPVAVHGTVIQASNGNMQTHRTVHGRAVHGKDSSPYGFVHSGSPAIRGENQEVLSSQSAEDGSPSMVPYTVALLPPGKTPPEALLTVWYTVPYVMPYMVTFPLPGRKKWHPTILLSTEPYTIPCTDKFPAK